MKPKQILEDEKAPATALLAVIVKKYGEECFEWEAPLLKAELQQDYSCEISDLQSDKIQAAITVLTTDVYESDIKAFETINYLFNHHPDNFDEINPLEAEELICGMTEAYLIRTEPIMFSPEVRVYAGKIFQDYGFHSPPKLFHQAIMEEREGNDDEKNEALQELFSEKIKVTENYLKACTI
jgi:hypothetical protein